jgi:hypothetical protein
MPGDWQFYALILAITVVLYALLSWLLGKDPHPVCVFCDGSWLYPGEYSANLGIDVHSALEPVSVNCHSGAGLRTVIALGSPV